VACPANFLELTATRDSVWIKTKDFEPRQFFGNLLQFSRPRAGETLAAKSCAKYLACQFWQGLGEASSKQPLKVHKDQITAEENIFRTTFLLLLIHHLAKDRKLAPTSITKISL
jgi:hypothetical protein